MKQGILTIIGAIGAFVSSIFGGWDAGLTTLVIFMAIDYFTGLVVAGVFRKSGKTKNGALSSKAGLQGIAKKIMMLLMVLVAVRLDIMTGTNYVRDAVIIALCGNELISIIENAGLMGVPIPRKLKEAIEVLSRKGKNNANPKGNFTWNGKLTPFQRKIRLNRPSPHGTSGCG